MEIKQLQKVVWSDSTTIPAFVNTKTREGKAINDHLHIIYMVVSRLIVNKVLSKTTLDVLHSQVREHLDEICQLSVEGGESLSASYLISTDLDKYLNMALDGELFEVAENIKNFNHLYDFGGWEDYEE